MMMVCDAFECLKMITISHVQGSANQQKVGRIKSRTGKEENRGKNGDFETLIIRETTNRTDTRMLHEEGQPFTFIFFQTGHQHNPRLRLSYTYSGIRSQFCLAVHLLYQTISIVTQGPP